MHTLVARTWGIAIRYNDSIIIYNNKKNKKKKKEEIKKKKKRNINNITTVDRCAWSFQRYTKSMSTYRRYY